VTYKVDYAKLDDVMGFAAKARENQDPIYEAHVAALSREVRTGFLAQEVEEAAAAVGYAFSGVDKPKNENDHYGLRYAEFVVPLVKATQEQQATIEELRQQVSDLQAQHSLKEAEVEQLRTMLASQEEMQRIISQLQEQVARHAETLENDR
jgi:flagellar biosynthesis chaperone FliJ